MLTEKQCIELYAACKLLSKNIRFIPGASYRDFVHDTLLSNAVNTVAQGVIVFKKLINKALNNARTVVMNAEKLHLRQLKSTELTRIKKAENPEYRASHNADCGRWEKEQHKNGTFYNALRVVQRQN